MTSSCFEMNLYKLALLLSWFCLHCDGQTTESLSAQCTFTFPGAKAHSQTSLLCNGQGFLGRLNQIEASLEELHAERSLGIKLELENLELTNRMNNVQSQMASLLEQYAQLLDEINQLKSVSGNNGDGMYMG